MARSIQRMVDGVAVDEFHARFKGTVPLEEPELPATAFDEVGVYVVVARAGDLTAKQDKKGNVYRIAGLTVTDARAVEGDLKRILVEKLNLYGVDVPPSTGSTDDEQLQLPLDADEETGEVFTDFTDITDEVDGIIGSIHNRPAEAQAEAGQSRLRVVPFRADGDQGPSPDIDGLSERQTVGRIRQTQDPALRRLLEEDLKR